MAAIQINHRKSSKPSDPQSRLPTPLRKKVDEPPENVDNGASISNFSKGCEKEEIHEILHANSKEKPSEMKFQSGATNLSSPSKLSHLSSVNHSEDKPVDYSGNHSIEGHPGQNYEMRDISLTCDQQIEVKPHVSNDTHSMLHLPQDINHSMDSSTNHHSNYSVGQLTSQEDTYSTKVVPSSSIGHNDSIHYNGTREKNGFNRLDDLKDESHQTSDGNMTSQFDKNNKTEDRQLPECERKKKKQAVVLEIYICLICKKQFRQSGNFQNHMKAHKELIHSCQCGNCGSVFDSAKTLVQHMQKEHTGSNPYKCDKCDRVFSQLNNLRRHLHVHVKSTLQCPYCPRLFYEDLYLRQHLSAHTGLRTYKCGVCNLKFPSARDFKDHVSSHDASVVHTCKVCSKYFSKACVLRQHMKSHSGLRPHICVLCKKTFILRHHLTMHFRSHTEKKSCETCGKKFSQAEQLDKHKREHLEEVKLSESSHEDSNDCKEKLINTSIPDKLNGEPHNIEQKTDQKRSRGPTNKVVSVPSSSYLHHASQISKANPFQYGSSDPGMFVPLSNEPTQKVMKQKNVPLPGHPPHYNPMCMASAPDVMAAYINNFHMMNYLSHSGHGLGNEYAEDLSLPKNPQSYESPTPLSQMRDSSPTVNSARNTPISSVPISQEHNQYFHNSIFARPVEVLNYNMPVPVNGPFDLSLPTVNSARNKPISSVPISQEHNQYFHNSTFARPFEVLSYNMPVSVNEPFDLSLPTVNSARNTPISSVSISQEHNQYFHNRTFARPFGVLSYNMPVPVNEPLDLSLPTVNSARNTPISSVPIYQEHNQYFHNSTFARRFGVLSYNMPVSVDSPVDLSLPKTQRIKYGSIGENDVEDLSSRGSLSNSPTSSVFSQPDTLSHNHESGPIDDHLESASTSIMKPHRDQSKKIKNNESRCDKPVGINGHTNSLPNDCSSQNKRKRLNNETHYGSNMKFKKEKGVLNSQDLSRGTAVEDRKLKNGRKLKAKGEKVDRKEEAYAEEEKFVEDDASEPEEISCLKQQIKEVREMIQREIQKETIDIMTDIEEEEEEGRLVIVEEDN